VRINRLLVLPQSAQDLSPARWRYVRPERPHGNSVRPKAERVQRKLRASRTRSLPAHAAWPPRTARRNRSVRVLHEDSEHRPRPPGGRAV